MKFDIVVGNPPYNKPKKNNSLLSGRPGSLWQDFVYLVFYKLLKINGYLCFIHPSRWRQPEDKLWLIMAGKQFQFLSIHNERDGYNIFGASTRYDWYVLQNKDSEYPCIIDDQDRKVSSIDFKDWSFLPNCCLSEIFKMFLTEGTEGYDPIYSTAYHMQSTHMKRIKTVEFCFPVIDNTTKSGTKIYYSSRNDRGLYGIPRIIVGRTGWIHPIIDQNGEFATTESAFSFAFESEEEKQIILSDLKCFIKYKSSFKFTGYSLSYKTFRYLRKGFSEIEDVIK